MSTGQEPNGNDRREQLERRAALVRARIEERLQLLEVRRDGLVKRVQSLTRPPLHLVLLVTAGVAGSIWIVHRARRRERTRLDLLPRRPRRRGWFARTLEKAVVSVGVAALHRLGTWGIDHWIGPDPRLRRPLPPRPDMSRLR